MQDAIQQLHAEFVRQIDLWQAETLTIQKELLALYVRKKADLTAAQFETMSGVISQEQGLLTRYAQQHQQREKILELLRRLDPQTASLTSWLKACPMVEASDVLARVQQVHAYNLQLRENCWSMWILANRSQQVYGEMVELITFAGKKAPTYDQDFSSRHSASSFLDASA
ncbi:flagellar export chaperone FlgN [Lacunimicrobium album]